MIVLRLVRGLIALVTLAGLVAGVPAALWSLGSPFLPDRLPTVDDVVVALTRPDDGSLLLGLLVLVGWIVWLQLAYSILVETAAQVRSLPMQRPDRFGFRTTRTLAALLIGWVLTMAATPATASTTPPVTVSASFLPTAAASAESPAGPVHVVQARDTLWDIAARVLGDPLRWREIFDLNDGRLQADGGRLIDGSVLHVGWELRLPAEPDPSDLRVRVEVGDSLTGLADQHLGDPARYPDLYEVNVGVRQPDGGYLDDPDVIRPGWLLSVPTIDGPVEQRMDDIPPPVDGTGPDPPPLTTSTPTPERPVPTGDPLTSIPLPETSAPTPPSDPTGGTDTAQTSFAVPAALVVSGLAASGIVTGIVAYRRRQTRWRRAGRQIALPDLDHSRLEFATVTAAQTAGTRFLDTVLRSLTVTPGLRHGLPSLEAVWLAPTGIDLVLTEPRDAVPPFVAEDGGSVWHVDAEAALPITEQEAVGVANPFPALVSLGTGEDGATLLVDAERAGALHLVGDRTRTIDLVRNMAVELGTCRWADDTSVMVVGLEAGLTDLPPNRVEQVQDVRTAAGRLRAAMSATQEHLARVDGGSVVDMRVQDQLSDSWVVSVLVVAEPDETQLQTLAELCRELATGERTSAAVITAGASTTLPGEQVHIDSDGTVQIPRLDTGTLRAERMPADIALGLLSVIGTALEHDVPVPSAPQPQPWADDMRSDGSLQPDTDSPEAGSLVIEIDDSDESPARQPLLTDVADQQPDPAAHRRLLLVEKQDPELDDDVALWRAQGPSARPLVSILGEPAFAAAGPLPEKRHSWYVEVVVYLALHPTGVDRDKITTDLWPEGSTVRPPTIRRAVAEARQWAGKNRSVDPPVDHIPSISPAGGDRYRITGHVMDWDLFRRLRKRAQARVAAGRRADATHDYENALRLVRGPVLHPLRQRGYGWLHNPDQRHEHLIPGFIIDTAHELVDLALDDDDIELARFAAETAQRVDPDRTFDRPFTDLMRIAHAAGDLAEMREHAELLLAERGFEVGEDLPPESFAVFDALFPHGLRVPTS
ncbi:LysM peptidoglycan-binding domain-containing protein [Pseudonocardia abyssalis]|jgi:hypothetical protein|uniref:LysM peptidoglycan-binding domain-containing protein n=1 Tax=Pseudonocardia abyssalis TaxID=2792008 RepID=A0ABS6UTB6_9PSEU|nr:LysM peptidoglycan-binding domain-containing protein [Pseudonocardia abyssalis]MBW0116281.1 LysM peptidoglycan-binding domain-containing protein [Pseudonocardia abyssalis]MBW0135103.1 LysM peptidoglycan-binding domain-containing protein [Pseudonocardia abyssalis]